MKKFKISEMFVNKIIGELIRNRRYIIFILMHVNYKLF
jgi:hypothetical protein